MDEGFEERIRDIRRRIEEQRAQLGYTQTQPRTVRKDAEVSFKPSNGKKEEQSRKNTELDDIKAKLMGGKK